MFNVCEAFIDSHINVYCIPVCLMYVRLSLTVSCINVYCIPVCLMYVRLSLTVSRINVYCIHVCLMYVRLSLTGILSELSGGP